MRDFFPGRGTPLAETQLSLREWVSVASVVTGWRYTPCNATFLRRTREVAQHPVSNRAKRTGITSVTEIFPVADFSTTVSTCASAMPVGTTIRPRGLS